MKRKNIAIICVAALVALAGCTSVPVGGGESSTDDDTSAPSDVEYPDGLSADGVDDSSVVADNHVTQLTADNFHIVQTEGQSFGEETIESETTNRVDIEQERLLSSVNSAGIDMQLSVYSADQKVYVQDQTQQETSYTVEDNDEEFEEIMNAYANSEFITEYLDDVSMEAVETDELNGEEVIIYEVTDASSLDSDEVDDVTGEFVIGLDGKIHHMSLEFTTEEQTVEMTIEYIFGTDPIDRPDWIDDAEESAEEGEDNDETDADAEDAMEP